jgi:CheY-like chemotaxis protein
VSPEQYHSILTSLDQALLVLRDASAEHTEQDREFLLELEILRSRILRAESGHPFPPHIVPTLKAESVSPFPAERPAVAAPAARPDRPRLRVLFADDHDSVRSILRALLLAEGDIDLVGEAVNGLAAVEQVRETKPDLVIMDLNMPGLDGISATREVLRLSPDTRVLVFSANRDPASVQKAEAAGASSATRFSCVSRSWSHTVMRFSALSPSLVVTIRVWLWSAPRILSYNGFRTPAISTSSALLALARIRSSIDCVVIAFPYVVSVARYQRLITVSCVLTSSKCWSMESLASWIT